MKKNLMLREERHGRWQENPAGLIYRLASVRCAGVPAQIFVG